MCVLVVLAPLLGASLIAISRCEDYRHDVYDVTVGSLLGSAIAYASYRRFFPGLVSRSCHEPYSETKESTGHGSLNGRREDYGAISRRGPAVDGGEQGEGDDDGEAVRLRDVSTDLARDLERGYA